MCEARNRPWSSGEPSASACAGAARGRRGALPESVDETDAIDAEDVIWFRERSCAPWFGDNQQYLARPPDRGDGRHAAAEQQLRLRHGAMQWRDVKRRHALRQGQHRTADGAAGARGQLQRAHRGREEREQPPPPGQADSTTITARSPESPSWATAADRDERAALSIGPLAREPPAAGGSARRRRTRGGSAAVAKERRRGSVKEREEGVGGAQPLGGGARERSPAPPARSLAEELAEGCALPPACARAGRGGWGTAAERTPRKRRRGRKGC